MRKRKLQLVIIASDSSSSVDVPICFTLNKYDNRDILFWHTFIGLEDS